MLSRMPARSSGSADSSTPSSGTARARPRHCSPASWTRFAPSARTSSTTTSRSSWPAVEAPPGPWRSAAARKREASAAVLVSRPRGPFTKALDGGKDFVGCLRPSERLWVSVADCDVLANRAFEFDGGAMRSASQLLVGEVREEALHLVDPRGAGRSEVKVEARMAKQPALDERGLVGAVVVENKMDVEAIGDVGIDGVEELSELDAAMPPVVFRDDLARLYV